MTNPRQPGRRTRRGWGKVHQLPSGRWQAGYVDLDGRRHNAPDTFDTEADADRWLHATRARFTETPWYDELAELSGILAEVSARLSALAGAA